jgi:hypothetical protein
MSVSSGSGQPCNISISAMSYCVLWLGTLKRIKGLQPNQPRPAPALRAPWAQPKGFSIMAKITRRTATAPVALSIAQQADNTWASNAESARLEEQLAKAAPQAPANGAPGTPPVAYVPRRYPPSTVLALGANTGKPGTVAYWFRQQLVAVLAAQGTQTCTMQAWVEHITANYQGLCEVSRAAPVKGQQLYAFASGYLRWQARHGQIVVQPS